LVFVRCKDLEIQESQSLSSQHSWICAGLLLYHWIDEIEDGLAQVTSALVQHWLTPTTCAGWTLMLAFTFLFCFFSKHILFKLLLYQGIWKYYM